MEPVYTQHGVGCGQACSLLLFNNYLEKISKPRLSEIEGATSHPPIERDGMKSSFHFHLFEISWSHKWDGWTEAYAAYTHIVKFIGPPRVHCLAHGSTGSQRGVVHT
mmetsp:Transcript_42858/g.79385  ORF Transcript_42858/g.79385 Transcript_42858/m.79385 type:complete len:107 (-) Transcript_42858:5-325(-)